eukprot:CAMPEP_0115851186 /NCGR_PEP_ID=MMETSP0287-20121206/12351_1 /TAXON_ID=412157 /ORGANISM="Chrysochromulina rotalis, Strain UIO044" /LENGTH=51 /DNA_ID=CAMNT_0003305209 /DNA_START=1172 /DNA_END=1327 /DNA_ORIENTATION=-
MGPVASAFNSLGEYTGPGEASSGRGTVLRAAMVYWGASPMKPPPCWSVVKL